MEIVAQDESPSTSRARLRARASQSATSETCRRRQAAAQIVDHLPATYGGKWHLGAFFRGRAATSENLGKKLPVATRPAMLPGGRGLVVRGKFVKKLDVGGQRVARKNTFEKIVAQQGVLARPCPGSAASNASMIVNSLCRCRSPLGKDPDTRPRPPMHTGQFHLAPKKSLWKSDPSRFVGSDGVIRGCTSP